MARFHGTIGYYVGDRETTPGSGIFTPNITEKDCSGDILRNVKSWETGEHLNDDVTISNRFSIVADDFANQNFQSMRYILWNGVRWEVSSVEIQRPRLIVTVGGVYNG